MIAQKYLVIQQRMSMDVQISTEMVGQILKLVLIGNHLMLLSGVTQIVMDMATTHLEPVRITAHKKLATHSKVTFWDVLILITMVGQI